ncbi:ParB N-terminal domain-containing protein [Halopseudomonas phragmitis]|uniref:ParB/Sulfiredoxin domain-containing protein n=1 Tax=Halopseudomonas phragmitis TaxID=1931241 RepID=A0A1V0B9F5_9GAMM|nr:ParB N-terminal domain-containing protein [Halopseudomonas phragmitis]AQZ96573.1 hypothetical protein BVH74_18255 [Halopseudomonas phragmitis]
MSETSERPVEYIALDKLLLDAENPRFGVAKGARRNQKEILDYIVENFGIDDVLSSLAYNGYFDAEPLIARKNDDGTYTIIEGNRRLSACLILSHSDRANNQHQRTSQFSEEVLEKWNEPGITIPVHVFGKSDNLNKLHAYLGVRHITSAKAWDSYAKAAWIDSVVSSGEMTLNEIAEVTGDKNNTIQRLLEGYYFVNQLIESGDFIPENSSRKGRGSNPEFPFSWIYTLLNYARVRDHLKLAEFDEKNQKPVPQDRVREASNIVRYMFGDRSSAQNGAITDSRQLGALATAISDPVQRDLLERGKSIDEIIKQTRPSIDQLTSSLMTCKEELISATGLVNSGDIPAEDAEKVLAQARDVANLAAALFRSIKNLDEPSPVE